MSVVFFCMDKSDDLREKKKEKEKKLTKRVKNMPSEQVESKFTTIVV